MKVKRFLAATAALLVLAAPAFAATAVTSGGDEQSGRSPEARAKSAHSVKHEFLRNLAASNNVRFARRLARIKGKHLPRNYARKAFLKPKWVLQRSNVRLGRELRALRLERARYRAAFRRVPRSTLAAIASCESHGNPRAIGGGGAYRGMFQMTFHIWGAVGGHGDPAAASVSEQYYRAALVYSRYGSGQWPVCGR
jgi:hypothetical protein